MPKLTIATRGSRLALWQAEHIKSRLLSQYPTLQVELLVLKTRGDIILDVPLAKVGGKGLFVKEIEEALLDGRADLAVHSMKDVPMHLPEGLVLGAIPEREDPSDILLSVDYPDLKSLPPGALVGTSSLRRQAQILSLRPDLRVESLRGNVDTRLRKLREGLFDAIVMAAAGISRLNLSAPKACLLPRTDFLPASGQGALGLEYAARRADLRELLSFLEHRETRVCVTAERAFLAALDGGCQTPIAANARVTAPGRIALDGLVADLNGRRIIRKSLQAGFEQPEQSGRALAEEIKTAGGAEILAEIFTQCRE